MCSAIGKLVGKVAKPFNPLRLMKKNKLKPKDFATGGASLLIGGDKYKNRTVNDAAPSPTNTNTGLTSENLL